MPEGDTILRSARVLNRALAGQTVITASAPGGRLHVDRIVGQSITRVEANGKHLFIHFGNKLALHSHMGMTGSWHLYRENERWRKSPQSARIVLKTAPFVAVCFAPQTIELVAPSDVKRIEQRLGPDILAPDFDPSEAIRRLQRDHERAIGDAIMDQSHVAGIGNIYKSESLHAARIHPLSLVGSLPEAALHTLLTAARRLMQFNVRPHVAIRRTRVGANGYAVYRRRRAACFTCGAEIEMIRQGELKRSTYFCPLCQKQVERDESEGAHGAC